MSNIEEIKNLEQLLKEGAITEEEFKKLSRNLLDNEKEGSNSSKSKKIEPVSNIEKRNETEHSLQTNNNFNSQYISIAGDYIKKSVIFNIINFICSIITLILFIVYLIDNINSFMNGRGMELNGTAAFLFIFTILTVVFWIKSLISLYNSGELLRNSNSNLPLNKKLSDKVKKDGKKIEFYFGLVILIVLLVDIVKILDGIYTRWLLVSIQSAVFLIGVYVFFKLISKKTNQIKEIFTIEQFVTILILFIWLFEIIILARYRIGDLIGGLPLTEISHERIIPAFLTLAQFLIILVGFYIVRRRTKWSFIIGILYYLPIFYYFTERIWNGSRFGYRDYFWIDYEDIKHLLVFVIFMIITIPFYRLYKNKKLM